MNSRSGQPMGLFNFPFFSSAPKPQPYRLEVRETEKELIIEGTFPGFEKEHIKLELIRTGILILAEKPVEVPEGEDAPKDVSITKMERYIPVHFTFVEEDVAATFSEEKVLKVIITKNDSHRKFISIK